MRDLAERIKPASTDNGTQALNSYDEKKEDEEELESQVSRMPSDLVTIHYERPCIRTVLHSLWSTHEDEANETNSSIYVCGPQRLNDAVREEVERQQKQNLAHQYKLIVL